MEVKVTIIVPTYNRKGLIGKTLDSISAQSISDWECIVIDDGSDDGTNELMNEYQEKDSRIKYIQRPFHRTKGASTCRNIGLENANGEFIQFLDSDDLISPNKLEEQILALQSSDSNSIATCKWGFFYTDNDLLQVVSNRPTYISTDTPFKLLDIYSRHSTYLPQHAFLVRKSVIEKAGYWNERLTNNDDTEFFARVLLCASKVVFVPSAAAYYRIGAGNNLGSLTNASKVRSAILSWELVDAAITKRYGISNHELVKVGRTEIYDRIKDEYPEIVEEYKAFFKLRRSKLKHLYLKALSRLELLYLGLSYS